LEQVDQRSDKISEYNKKLMKAHPKASKNKPSSPKKRYKK
jgi:hypothetical protein